MTEAAAPIRTRAATSTRWLGKLEGRISWILLGLAGLLLPLLDDSYIGTIATRAYIYWVLSAGLNLVVGYAGQIAIGWVSMLTLGAYTTAALAAGRVGPEWNSYLALLAGEQSRLLRQLGRALILKRRIVTAIRAGLGMLDVDDVIDDPVEKFAVVRNEQQRPGIVQQPSFQPQNGIEIEVIGRLVE